MSIDPTTKSGKFTAVESQWSMVDSLMGGTQTMRAAGERYLPRNPKELESDYTARVARTTLFNAYKRSIQHAVARAFTKDVALEGYPGELTIFMEDVDSQGRDLTQFSKAIFTDSLNRGISYLLVEFPRRDVQPLTLADAIASGDRPYWVPIPATNVLAAFSVLEGGSERLTYFRFIENLVEPTSDGLSEQTIQQVKVFKQPFKLSPVTFDIYRKDSTGTWFLFEGDVPLLGMPQIPVVPDYTNRTGFFIGTPPLLDLAETNVAHWQSSSEQRNILHVARVPFLHVKGMAASFDGEGKPKEQEISIHSVLVTDKEGDAKWVETTGAGIKAGADDLADLESKMEALGLMLTAPRSGTATATENSINAAESNSILKDYALALADTLEQALFLTGMYLGLDVSSGKVVIDTSFAVDLQTSASQVTDQPTP